METRNYLFIGTITALSCILVSLVARRPFSKPLLKIWFFIFEIVPTVTLLVIALINLFLMKPIFEVDALFSSIELFIMILTLVVVDKAVRLKKREVLTRKVKVIPIKQGVMPIKHDIPRIGVRELG